MEAEEDSSTTGHWECAEGHVSHVAQKQCPLCNLMLKWKDATVDAPLHPEHEKLKLVSDESQVIGDFLEWLAAGRLDRSTCHPGGRRLRSYGHIELAFRMMKPPGDERYDDLSPLAWKAQDVLAAYFEIDQDKIEAEKMLEALRAKILTPR